MESVVISKQLQRDLECTLNHLTPKEQEAFRDSRILITGCGGFLGYYLMRFFEAYGKSLCIKKITALDNFILGKPAWIETLSENPLFDFEKFDITKDSIESLKESEKADFVVHAASIASPVFYRRHPIETLDANVWGLRRLLDFYKTKTLRGFLFFSSSEIYGDPSKDWIPTPEDYRGSVSATGPRACYDEAKRFGETLCMLYSKEFSMPIGVARPFNNYGPGMRIKDRRAPADFALAVLEGKDIKVLSDGSPTRTFCHVADAWGGYLKILTKGAYGYYNIGIDRPEICIKDLAEIYKDAGRDLFSYKGTVVLEKPREKDYLTHNPSRRCPSIEKARAELGFHPKIQVKEGVYRFLEFLKTSQRREYDW